MGDSAIIGAVLAGIAYIILYSVRARRLRRGKGITVTHRCSQCGEGFRVGRDALKPLSMTEKGLSVASDPSVMGKDLRSHNCPKCRSVQIFAIRGGHAEFVGADMFTPHMGGTHCLECRRDLSPAPWTAGAYDGKFDDAPGLSDEIGVECSRCASLVCFGCAKSVTRKRADDGAYQCPRCSRMSIDRFYHGGTSTATGA